MVDFKEEQNKIFSEISDIRCGIKPQGVESLSELNNRLGILTTTSLWLISNSSEINDMKDFREKLNSFERVLAHPLFMEMEKNLCVASGVKKQIDGCWKVNEFGSFADIAGISSELSTEEYNDIIKKYYAKAKKFFMELKKDKAIEKDAKDCCFAMNFKFNEDYSELPNLYSSVSIYRDVAQNLEDIYEKKSVNGSKKSNKARIDGKKTL